MGNNKTRPTAQNILVFAASIIITLALLEGGARLLIYFLRGSSTVGTQERTLYLEYKPFVMFGPEWSDKAAAYMERAEKEKGSYRILLVGGSTAANFPAELLEEAFARRFPGRKFIAANASCGGYNARQELIVAALWGPSFRPDVVVSLDGANDLIHRLRMKRAGSFYLDATYEAFIKRPMLAPVIHMMIKSQLIQGLARMRERKSVKQASRYMDAVPVYIQAQHSMNLLAKGMGAGRIMVLQPFMAFKKPLSADEANFKSYSYREAVVKELYAALDRELAGLAEKDGSGYLDGRPIFNGMPQTVFSDDVHFVSDEGYRILAKSIASAVNENDLGIR